MLRAANSSDSTACRLCRKVAMATFEKYAANINRQQWRNTTIPTAGVKLTIVCKPCKVFTNQRLKANSRVDILGLQHVNTRLRTTHAKASKTVHTVSDAAAADRQSLQPTCKTVGKAANARHVWRHEETVACGKWRTNDAAVGPFSPLDFCTTSCHRQMAPLVARHRLLNSIFATRSKKFDVRFFRRHNFSKCWELPQTKCRTRCTPSVQLSTWATQLWSRVQKVSCYAPGS